MIKQSVIAILASSLLVACGDSSNGFEDQYRQGFVKSCEESSTAAGTPADIATKVCDCSADKVMSDYTAVERAQLRGDKIDEILDQCLADLDSGQS